MLNLSTSTAVIVGAGRGLGRGIAESFAKTGAQVVAVARTGEQLDALARSSGNINAEKADAVDPEVARSVLGRYQPNVLILVAGATPVMAPIQDQTWETLSVNWHSDVKIAFEWLRAALLQPLPPACRIVVVSSGAAIHGSPASGGYAGAKSTQRFLARYAQEEAARAGLDVVITTVMPAMTVDGDVGRAGVRGYAARAGMTEDAFLRQQGPPPTLESVGSAIVDLVRSDPASLVPEYLLTGGGVVPIA